MTETVPEFGGCEWPIDVTCAGDDWDALDPGLRQRAVRLASATLTRLTGGRVSECPITVRPCKPRVGWNSAHPYPYYTGYPYTPRITESGAWINVGCCAAANCACQVTCSVALPRPVSRIDEVRVNGEVLPTTDYFVSGDNLLVWSGDGPCPFPAYQDLSRSDSEPDTFSITYLNAYPVDAVGACAAGVLAAEFAKAMRGGKCRLPSNVTSVVRQGITMEVASGAFPDGQTGLREVDSFIALWNPRGLERQASVWSPDLNRPTVQRSL